MTDTNVPPPGSQLACTACGDCCDPVELSSGQYARMVEWGAWFEAGGVRSDEELVERYAGDPDPDLATPEGRRARSDRFQRDTVFAYRHWTLRVDDSEFDNVTCDHFDSATRMCTAHEDRPPVCSDYPWYSTGPTLDRLRKLPLRCVFRDEPVLLTTKREVPSGTP